ncbi:MAG: SRPBCC domain-containing protein [Acidimicrobiia bacterium]|nr:SRPBCC domain-containing protein [Acidimicrobiia bacterium]
MTVTAIKKDPEKLTMAFTAEFESTPERVWQLWEDPSLFEKWWGPPEYPATVIDHDFSPGGKVRYYMTGPEGEKYHGWSEFIAIDPPKSLEFGDGFLDDDGNEVEGMPTMTSRVVISEIESGTRMVITTSFPSLEAMEQLIEMGAEEGMKGSLSQVPELLAAMA